MAADNSSTGKRKRSSPSLVNSLPAKPFFLPDRLQYKKSRTDLDFGEANTILALDSVQARRVELYSAWPHYEGSSTKLQARSPTSRTPSPLHQPRSPQSSPPNVMNCPVSTRTLAAMPLPEIRAAPGTQPPVMLDHGLDGCSMESRGSQRSNKGKSSRDTARLRSLKRHDIVSRCLELNPPITEDVLERLDAFETALSIPSIELNENSWPVLRHLLEAQARKLSLVEQARASITVAPVPGQFSVDPVSDEFVIAHADTPPIERLKQIADEYVRKKWIHGSHIDYATAPYFAADILTHTQKQYLADTDRIVGLIPHFKTEALTLYHMKFIFEKVILPRTEHFRQELFLCNDCPVRNSNQARKYFRFEAVLQHAAAKHTKALSYGEKKVHWATAWPEHSPFDPDPMKPRSPIQKIAMTSTVSQLSSQIASSFVLSRAAPMVFPTPDAMSIVSSDTNMTTQSEVPEMIRLANLHDTHMQSLAEIAHLFQTISRSMPLDDNLYLYLCIQFISDEFRRRNHNTMSLVMLADFVEKRPDVFKLYTSYGLQCAQCESQDHQILTFSGLLTHFQNLHLTQSASRLDWLNDMIKLPHSQTIKSVARSPGLDIRLLPYVQQADGMSIIRHSEKSILSSKIRGRQQDPFQNWGVHDASSPAGRSRHILSSQNQAAHLDPQLDSLLRRRAPTIQISALPTAPSVNNLDKDDDMIILSNPVSCHSRPSSAFQSQQMTRTDTMRTYRSTDPRSMHGQDVVFNEADDFLNTIEASIDAQTAHVSHPGSALHSRPGSRSVNRESYRNAEPLQYKPVSHDHDFTEHNSWRRVDTYPQTEYVRVVRATNEPGRFIDEHGRTLEPLPPDYESSQNRHNVAAYECQEPPRYPDRYIEQQLRR